MSFTIDDWGSDDTIDSREILERLDELTEEQADLASDVQDAVEAVEAEERDLADEGSEGSAAHLYTLQEKLREAELRLKDWEDENLDELQKLKEIARQGQGYGDWDHGETLIREGYFKEYAQQLAEDIGAIEPNLRWPYTHIDWEAAANDLKHDYTKIDCDGHTYLMRA